MPPTRTKKAAAASDASSSTILKRPRGRPRKDGNVSLSSTVGAPTPARRPASASSSLSARQKRAADYGDVSLASTVAPSTPAQPKKRGRPPKAKLTTPAMRAFESGDTTSASTPAVPKRRGRPPKPKSILSTPGNRTQTSPNNSVSFSDEAEPRAAQRKARQADTNAPTPAAAVPRKRGRPPKSAAATPNTSVSTSTPAPKRRGRPPGSGKAKKTAAPAAPAPARAVAAARPEKRSRPAEVQAESDVELVDGVSDEASEASEADDAEDADAMSSDGGAGAAPRRLKAKKRKGWPSERERLRKWRRLSLEERECITSEGGLVWRTAIPLLNSMPKNIRSMVADSLTRALNRIDAKLETGLVPPLARIPAGSVASVAGRRELPSSMLAWRLEEEGSLLRAEASTEASEVKSIDTMSLGMNAEIMELEQMLLPEAEQIVGLSKTLEHQSQQLDQARTQIGRLKRERKLIKVQGTSDYPANLQAHELLSATAHKPDLDPPLGSYFRLPH